MEKPGRKGQGAMEHLMVYGWAIFVVMLLGIVMWKIGVFNPKSTTGFSEFRSVEPIDHTNPSAGDLDIVFMNAVGSGINMNVTVASGGDSGKQATSEGNVNAWVSAGDSTTFNFAGGTLNTVCQTGANRYDITLNVNYYNQLTGLRHTESGRIWGPCGG